MEGGEVKVYKFKCTYSATVVDTMKRRGWVEVDEDGGDDWNIFFCDLNQLRDIFSSNLSLGDNQRVGHFRNCFEMSRKNLMVKNLKRLKQRIERAFGKEEGQKCNFFPTTYVLPCEHKLFIQEFRRLQPENALWIIKPAAGAQGKGIFIFQRYKDYHDWRQKFDTSDSLDAAGNPASSLLNNNNNNKVTSSTSSKENLLPSSGSLLHHDLHQSHVQQSSSSSVTEGAGAGMAGAGGAAAGGAAGGLCPVASSLHDCCFPGDPAASLLELATEPLEQSKELLTSAGRNSEVYVVQRYIDNPYLIGGRKFDIRFYVLVTSFMPLKAWIYREGFARFSGGQFSLESLQDIYVHLTNIAIQRTSEDYNPEKGSKWSLRSLREYLTARHGREEIQKLMNNIDNIVVRTLQSAHQLVIQDRHCFEIYGFDVIIDSDVRPWLLEVNASPAFTPSNEDDYRLKCGIIDDTVHVLDLENRLTGYEKRVGGYDMFWNDGPVYANPGDCGHSCGIDNGPKLNSFLGCLNDRILQLRQIFRNAQFIKEAQHILACPSFSPVTPPCPDRDSNNNNNSNNSSNTSSSNNFNASSTSQKVRKTDVRFRVPSEQQRDPHPHSSHHHSSSSGSSRNFKKKQIPDQLKIIGSSVMR